ncbi:MAG: hypothetical protein QNJ55_06340 [Xenococcus sp. MO_188.B8]|nr:hypothetical protein [Xenococcus sp. MO_188.B8]
MSSSITCPCCSENMLHHLSGRRDYWFCPSCREEMPDLNAIKSNRVDLKNQIINLSIGLDMTPKMALA